MFDYIALAHNFVNRRRRQVLLAVTFLIAIAGIAIFFIKFEGNIDLMLPNDKEIRRSIDFLRDSNLSDKVIVSLALTAPDKDEKDLFYAADKLAASLVPPLFTKVSTGFSIEDAMGDLSFVKYAPQILNEKDLLLLDSQINSAGVSESMRSIYRQSIRPASIYTMSIARSDPLGINNLLLNKLRILTSSMGYDVNILDGHFISRDGRHTMLIIETPIAMTDGPGSKTLIDALRKQIGSLPEYVSADIISGHLHTMSNEKVIKSDIRLASVISAVAFLTLFVLVFRDFRIIFIFIIPILAVILAINLSNFFIGNLSYLVIGLGTVIAGITIDYGMHVYIALKKGVDMSQTVNLSKLLFIDAITTVVSFSALFFSKVQGYHQLAFFSILSIAFSLAFALFVLPLTLSWKVRPHVRAQTAERSFEMGVWHRKSYVILWALLTAGLLLFSFNIKVDSDIIRLDGSEQEVLNAEKTFHKVWGGEDKQAILVATGNDYEKVMEANEEIYQKAAQTFGVSETRRISSLAALWSSEKQRKQNIERWNSFWREGREEKLKRLINEQSMKYQFSEGAFSPFFDNLYDSKDSKDDNDIFGGGFDRLKERFIQKKDDEYRIMSFFPDEKGYIEKMSSIIKNYPESFIVSRKVLSSSISEFTSKEVKYLAGLAVIFNVVLTFLFFKSIRETLIALVPVATCLIWLFGLMSIFGLTLNVVNIIAVIIISGIVVDFGIGMTYECQYDLKLGTVIAVTLSAATTVIGAGALIFAEHPVLFPIGLSIVISVLSGYLTSVFVVPPLCDILLGKNPSSSRNRENPNQ